MTRTRWIAGCMTGTSLDGLDVALAEIEGTGLDMKATFRGMVSKPLGDLAKKLRHFAEGKSAPPIDYLRAARELGELHADAVEELCKKHLQNRTNSTDLNTTEQSPPTPVGGSPVGGSALKLDFIVAHGQTIWHAPAEHLSWQLFDPWPLARRLRVPVCYDLRQADLIAGGQGAPISPIADWVMYRHTAMQTLVVNLGGICNITRLHRGGPDQIAGHDGAPCNIVIDGVTRLLFPDLTFDRDGLIAASGTVHAFAQETLLRHPKLQDDSLRETLGREDFPESYLRHLIAAAPGGASKSDVLASVVDAVAHLIAAELSAARFLAVIAGGGARNPTLVRAIRDKVRGNCRREPPAIVLSDDLGIPCEAREALAFAILGALAQDGVPITLPQVTGAKAPGRAGAWVYP